MQLGKKSIIGMLCLLICVILTSTVQAGKSVYVINDADYSQMQAYEINDTALIYLTNYQFVSHNWGPVGIAIGESDYGDFLFVTFEFTGEIEIVDAKTMEYVGTVTATGASDLAGIVVDQGNSKIYVMDRYTNHLYSYSWNPVTKTLTPDFNDPYYIELQDLEYNGYSIGAFGIALDEENGLLYVGNNTNNVKYYDTSDWSKKGEVNNVSCNVIGIAIDVNNQLLYYGSMGSYGQGDPCLYKYNISSHTENSVNVGSSVAGIAVNQETGLVYITTYEDGNYDTQGRLMIYDSNLVKQPWESGDIGNPAGVCVPSGDVSYKPPSFSLAKDNNDPNNACVEPWDPNKQNYLTFDIRWDANSHPDTNVVMVDQLPAEVDYNSSSPAGDYNDFDKTVKWNIGDIGPGASGHIVLKTKVNY